MCDISYVRLSFPDDFLLDYSDTKVYNANGCFMGWLDDAYHAITFSMSQLVAFCLTASEWGEIGAATEYTPTWNVSDFAPNGITVKVNDDEISSPYTLINGDRITLDSADAIVINGAVYVENTRFDLSNVDIIITRDLTPNLYSSNSALIINYIAQQCINLPVYRLTGISKTNK